MKHFLHLGLVHTARKRNRDRDRERNWKNGLLYIIQNCSYCTGPEQGQGPGSGTGNLAMGSTPIFPVHVPIPVPCSVNAPLLSFVFNSENSWTLPETLYREKLNCSKRISSCLLNEGLLHTKAWHETSNLNGNLKWMNFVNIFALHRNMSKPHGCIQHKNHINSFHPISSKMLLLFTAFRNMFMYSVPLYIIKHVIV